MLKYRFFLLGLVLILIASGFGCTLNIEGISDFKINCAAQILANNIHSSIIR